ncbi:MAG TPA: ATP-binding protein [Terriglobales bacterium]|nr:ATP-binding protein [Terriglobales bacterium]
MLSSISIVAVVFAGWELLDNHFFRDVDYLTLHYLYITRGIVSSLLLAIWAAWFVLRQRRQSEDELRRSREHYRGLLEASPGAVALYDAELRVVEWNAAAANLYGYSKAEVLGESLPTICPEKREEHQRWLQRVQSGESPLELETIRRAKDGVLIPVELMLLAYREGERQDCFLEVTEDIRERVRMREKLIEFERLTSMGRIAAGTAHHLNSPLAAMLLRVQMMRERRHQDGCGADLGGLEEGLKFCQQFVRRLLDFSRRAPAEKQPQEVCQTLESIVNFLGPAFLTKGARVKLERGNVDGGCVLADPNQLETVFLILLTNALDALGPKGTIEIRCQRLGEDGIEIRLSDDGSGIAPTDLSRVFEPFFTTKPPGKGTGLGLAIARNIIEDHGGSIHLDSRLGQGTTARIELPLRVPALQQVPL